MNPRCQLLNAILAAVYLVTTAPGAQPAETLRDLPPATRPGPAERARTGPWNNDVHVYQVSRGAAPVRVATFPRAGVPTLARLGDGRIMAAFQHFPADDQRNFDRVAVSFSRDDGRTWTPAAPIVMAGLEAGLARPFDPTLVPLPDGRIRLYFTSNRSRDFRQSTPSIHSAISTNGIHYVYEPGERFAVADRVVIDCAVALHRGVFHLIAPDNGTADELVRGEQRGEPSRGGTAYHATSTDGLRFERQADLHMEDSLRWLGNLQSESGRLDFFGTGNARGVWRATSEDGRTWVRDRDFPRVAGADPGAVSLRDGGWLLAVTGPPRDGRGAGGPGGAGPGQGEGAIGAGGPPGESGGPGQRPAPPVPVLMNALDANADGILDEWELANAAALLRKLDRDGDGRLGPDELRPRPGGNRDAAPEGLRRREPVEGR